MDEWLKSHIAFILPCAYACYAVDGELSRTTVEQRRMIVDAAWECCEMLKAAGVPVNDAENTDRYREGTKHAYQLFFLTKNHAEIQPLTHIRNQAYQAK